MKSFEIGNDEAAMFELCRKVVSLVNGTPADNSQIIRILAGRFLHDCGVNL